MNIIRIQIILIVAFLSSCANYEKTKSIKEDSRVYYSSTGFALIYDTDLYKNKIINRKINTDDISVIHRFLKKGTRIRITNLENSKYVETKIKKKGNYPEIFNSVLSKKIAFMLDLDENNPFVEIIELKKNKTFIAKEGNTFDEEKNVADKAPVDKIELSNLSNDENSEKKKININKNFLIIISDFYYKDSALNLKNELYKKIKLGNISIRKINNNKYRLLVGPFKNFNALKKTYISLNNLGFEDLNIYNE